MRPSRALILHPLQGQHHVSGWVCLVLKESPIFHDQYSFLYFNYAHVFLWSVKQFLLLLYLFTTKSTGVCSLFSNWMSNFLSTWSPGEILAALSQLGFLISHIWHVQSLQFNTGTVHKLPYSTIFLSTGFKRLLKTANYRIVIEKKVWSSSSYILLYCHWRNLHSLLTKTLL